MALSRGVKATLGRLARLSSTKTTSVGSNLLHYQSCLPFSSVTYPSYTHILTETRSDPGIGIVTLNRPKALNALCIDLLDELVDALEIMQKDTQVRSIILTGSGEKAFCAGMLCIIPDCCIREDRVDSHYPKCGVFHDGDYDFITDHSSKDGTLQFGDVIINTGPTDK